MQEAFPGFRAGLGLACRAPARARRASCRCSCYHAMQHCDVIVYDALVNADILRWARPGAELEYAGKRGGKPRRSSATFRCA